MEAFVYTTWFLREYCNRHGLYGDIGHGDLRTRHSDAQTLVGCAFVDQPYIYIVVYFPK